MGARARMSLQKQSSCLRPIGKQLNGGTRDKKKAWGAALSSCYKRDMEKGDRRSRLRPRLDEDACG